jgi:hypothetical protein
MTTQSPRRSGATSLPSDAGSRLKVGNRVESSRSVVSAGGRRLASQVDLPVPSGPFGYDRRMPSS